MLLRYKTETRPGLVVLYDIRPGNGATPEPPRGLGLRLGLQLLWFCTCTTTPMTTTTTTYIASTSDVNKTKF